jgi:hypothetical protein
MSLRAVPAPLWFVAALVPIMASQIVRLEQSDPATWILWDYAGRIGALAVLGAIPSARTVAINSFNSARCFTRSSLCSASRYLPQRCLIAMLYYRRLRQINKMKLKFRFRKLDESHGVSLLRWRSGGVEHPTIRRLTPSCRHQLSPVARTPAPIRVMGG